MNSEKSEPESKIYFVIFEEYLQPKRPQKLQSFVENSSKEKRAWHLQLLENPIVKAQSFAPRRWRTFFEKIKQNKLLRKTTEIGKTINASQKEKGSSFTKKLTRFNFGLPNFLSFLHPRNDDNVCRRKTGFEIYCEMASVHGFKNFIDAKFWQRLFWILIISFAICMVGFVTSMAFVNSLQRPTIFYTEGITDPTWPILVPAITICNLNRISQRETLKVADKFLPYSSLPRHEILRLFRLTLYATQEVNATNEDLLAFELLLERNNYTIKNLLQEISPKCGQEEYKLCKSKGHHERCQSMIEEVSTPIGVCCSYNFFAYKKLEGNIRPEHSTSCGYQTGLTLVMSSIGENYNLSMHKFFGHEVYLHDTMDIPNEFTEKRFVSTGTETSISVTPRSTYSTNYLRSKSISLRRCYFPEEFQLVNFQSYSLPNCLAECRSRKMYAKCNCVPPFWPKLEKAWNFCQTAKQINCSLSNRDIINELVEKSSEKSTGKRLTQKFSCDCLPLCTYNQYTSTMESTPLSRRFALYDRRLFKGIRKIGDYTLLHVFFGDLIAENFRYDVTESWLSSTGTIGGIAGLYMGFSFISIFEIAFFVLVRPFLNWLTREKLRYEKSKKALAKRTVEQKSLEKSKK